MEKTTLRSIEDWTFWMAQKGVDPTLWPQPESFPCIGLFKSLRAVALPVHSDVIVEYVYQYEL